MSEVLFIVYDNGSHIHTFPHNVACLVGYLESKGIYPDIYHQDVYHYSEEHLADFLSLRKYDLICLGFVGGYYQYKKVKSISKIINESVNRPELYVLGGHGPSPDPEFFLNKMGADVVVRGEGERTLYELITSTDLHEVEGISFTDAGLYFHNKDRELIKDINILPIPAYHRFPIDYYKSYKIANSGSSDAVMSVQTSRGCTFKCTFCYRMDKGYRRRDTELVLDEIRYLHSHWNINYINFYDELLMSNVSNTIEFCENIISSGLKFKWYCNGRLNYAKPEVLRLMKESGCVYINYGVESLDNDVLRNIHKGLTIDVIKDSIAKTIQAGIDPGINMMFGNIGDTKETLLLAVSFMLENCPDSELRTIRPVTPYPGSMLFEFAVKQGLIKDVEDFYENKHINSDLLTVNFTEMSNDEIYQCLASANRRLFLSYQDKLHQRFHRSIDSLYIDKNVSFRGFRQE